jgi:CheY-like chemotaxis protein
VEGAPERIAPARSAQLPMRAKTILLVEDEESLRGLIAGVLKRQGYRVVAAANGRAALETLRTTRENIDLVLADVVMPEMGGPALADALAMERPGVPVVFMSGYTDHHILGARALGGYLQKPFTAGELLRRLEKVWAAGRGQVSGASG